MKQVDTMRQLHAHFGGDEEKVVEEYAQAEKRREVERDSNTYGYSSREYARRLFYNTFKCKDR